MNITTDNIINRIPMILKQNKTNSWYGSLMNRSWLYPNDISIIAIITNRISNMYLNVFMV